MGNKKPEPDTAKSSALQLLRDPDIQLTDAVFREALGPANAAYRAFLDELPNHDIQLEWRYYTDGKAWLGKGLYRWKGARGGQKEMTVFWMSILDGFFKVSIFFPEASRADLLALPLGEEMQQMITNSRQMGKTLKFFPVVFNLCSDEFFAAVFALADFKKSTK